MGDPRREELETTELTTDEEVDGQPTLPLNHVLHVADEQAEHEDWEPEDPYFNI